MQKEVDLIYQCGEERHFGNAMNNKEVQQDSSDDFRLTTLRDAFCNPALSRPLNTKCQQQASASDQPHHGDQAELVTAIRITCLL
jgi:hypothetical protein